MNIKKIIYLVMFFIVLTQVYSVNTTMEWNKTINGPGNWSDFGNSIAVDSSGNSYVTGYVTTPDLTTDIYVISYDSSGVNRWNKSINGPGDGYDQGNSIAVDSSGNSYITGYVFNGVNNNIYIISYDSNGVHRWNKSIDGPGNGNDRGNSIVVDSSGNSYITGYVYDNVNFNSDIYIISYDSSGVYRWNKSINGPGNDWDFGNSIVVDSSGNSYITGYGSNGVNDDIYITSYNSSGVHRWNKSIDGPGNGLDRGNSIVVDSSGNSYMTGFVSNGVNDDIYITSYNSSGVHRWNKSINGPGNGGDSGNSIVVDSSGNSYITGFVSNGVNDDIYIISYDSSGVHRWNKSINGLGNGGDSGNSIVVDSSGNSYMTGHVSNGVNEDIYITSYDSSGVHRWNKSIDGPGNWQDIGYSIVVDSSGNSYITGHVFNGVNQEDIYILKISEDGQIVSISSSNRNSIFPMYSISSIIATLSLLIGFFILN